MEQILKSELLVKSAISIGVTEPAPSAIVR